MAQNDSNALSIISKEKTLEKLKYSVSLLDAINKGLNIYLGKKRLFFPRFIK